MKVRKNLGLVLLVAFLLVACSGGASTQVLFIGNSYTFGNNLPDMFSELAESGGYQVSVGMAAEGGWWLRDHASSEATADTITSRDWDYVFLQEQSIVPSVPGEVASSMSPAVSSLVSKIRLDDSTPGLYLTWARRNGFPDVGYRSYQPMQDAITATYFSIGNDYVMPVAPVGVAWNRVLADFTSIPLYMADGSHPTIHGTYLAACVFYATIFAESPEGLEFDAQLGEDVASVLQQIAAETVLTDPSLWNVKMESEE